MKNAKQSCSELEGIVTNPHQPVYQLNQGMVPRKRQWTRKKVNRALKSEIVGSGCGSILQELQSEAVG